MSDRKFRRMVWCDIVADFHEPSDIDRFIDWCHEVKIDLVLPCINHGTGVMCYPSKFVPTAIGYDSWDALGYLIGKSHALGIEVHPWLVVANWGTSLLPKMAGVRYIPGGPPPLQETHPDWFAVDIYGHSVVDSPSVAFGEGGTCFLDPAHPDARKFLIDLTEELFTKYPQADGLHLDYIRYESVTARMEWDIQGASDLGRQAKVGDGLWITKPSTKFPGSDDMKLYYEIVEAVGEEIEGRPQNLKLERHYKYCYCESCLNNFASKYQIRYPGEVDSTKAKHDLIWAQYGNEWVTWRAEQVTELVRMFAGIVHNKFDKELSAATFWNHPPIVRSHGQDWIKWMNEGLLDFVNPMTYWIPAEKVGEMTASYIERTSHSCPVYPGIITSKGYPVKPEEVDDYVNEIVAAGGDGITLFCYSTWGTHARWQEGIGDKYKSVLASSKW